MIREVVRDWIVGEDPGMSAWQLAGDDGVLLVPNDLLNGAPPWTVRCYDITLAPEDAITPDSNSEGNANSNNWVTKTSGTIDGYWTRGGQGYNVRHYIENQDYTTTPFVAGHEYRFVYTVETDDWGNIILVRRGRCLPQK